MFCMKATYCTGHGPVEPPLRADPVARSSARAPGSAISVTGSPVSLTTVKIVRLRINRVIDAVAGSPDDELAHADASHVDPLPALVLQLDVFPRIGVAAW